MARYNLKTTGCEMEMIEKSIKAKKPVFALTVTDGTYPDVNMICFIEDELSVDTPYGKQVFNDVEFLVTSKGNLMFMQDEDVICKISIFSGFPQKEE